MSWKPISTAPKDGTRLRLWCQSRNQEVHGSWRTGCPAPFDDYGKIMPNITHWQSVSKPPPGEFDWYAGEVDLEAVREIVRLKQRIKETLPLGHGGHDYD